MRKKKPVPHKVKRAAVKKIIQQDMKIAKRNEVYNWEAWADGEWHELTKGVDFNIPLEVFRSGACAHARRHNWGVSTKKIPTPIDKPQVLAIKFEAF